MFWIEPIIEHEFPLLGRIDSPTRTRFLSNQRSSFEGAVITLDTWPRFEVVFAYSLPGTAKTRHLLY
jgi:hypothetical protein